jgi:hypothetical protein
MLKLSCSLLDPKATFRWQRIYRLDSNAMLRVSGLEQKPSKRDVAASAAMLLRHDEEYELNTSGRRPFFRTDNYLKIDNTNLPAAEVAAIIESRFRL